MLHVGQRTYPDGGMHKTIMLRPEGGISEAEVTRLTSLAGMLTYAHVCSRMLTYAHVCSRMLTYAKGGISEAEVTRLTSLAGMPAYVTYTDVC